MDIRRRAGNGIYEYLVYAQPYGRVAGCRETWLTAQNKWVWCATKKGIITAKATEL